jgi:hypothetical protein
MWDHGSNLELEKGHRSEKRQNSNQAPRLLNTSASMWISWRVQLYYSYARYQLGEETAVFSFFNFWQYRLLNSVHWHSTTWSTPPALFVLLTFEWGSHLMWGPWSHLGFPVWWDDRCTPCLAADDGLFWHLFCKSETILNLKVPKY